MPLLPTCLTAACPWCGQRTLAPVATPLRELDAWLESRCGACRGGMRGRSSWRAFAGFALGVGLLSDLTLALALEGHLALATPLTAAYALGFAGASVALAAFLVANSTVRRGQPPAERQDGW